MLVQRLFKRRWILSTLLVVIALGVLIRLGIWQLDRLHQRKELNAKVVFQKQQPTLNLTGQDLEAKLADMEYRHVEVEGEYDPSNQVILGNQTYQGQLGAHLLTPLRIRNSDQVILVDRGWIPAEEALSGSWSQYDEPGLVKVFGLIRLPQNKLDIGRIFRPEPTQGNGPIRTWYLVNLEQMQKQMPYPLVSVYVQETPDPSWTRLPYRTEPKLDLTEGPHLSYALQWFTFALVLAVGYPIYVQREETAHGEGNTKNYTLSETKGKLN